MSGKPQRLIALLAVLQVRRVTTAEALAAEFGVSVRTILRDVQALIDAHADLKAHSKQGFAAIHFAARRGDLECVQLLLAAGVDINLLTHSDEPPGPPRTSTAVGGRKTPGVNGYTPLLVATVRGQVPLALFLLEHGANPDIGDAGFTPLHWASTEWESFTANRVY